MIPFLLPLLISFLHWCSICDFLCRLMSGTRMNNIVNVVVVVTIFMSNSLIVFWQCDVSPLPPVSPLYYIFRFSHSLVTEVVGVCVHYIYILQLCYHYIMSSINRWHYITFPRRIYCLTLWYSQCNKNDILIVHCKVYDNKRAVCM